MIFIDTGCLLGVDREEATGGQNWGTAPHTGTQQTGYAVPVRIPELNGG